MTCAVSLAAGCSGRHLITNKTYLNIVDSAFKERRFLYSAREDQLTKVLGEKLDNSQSDAIRFLYAFMPLSDLADYSGDFFLENSNIALDTRNNTSWGSSIPEEIFLHYVLPCRINNENLDSFRIKYHFELSERIKGLEMGAAALEINHWCHEKVTYQPSDIRTSGPLSTILSARGRCGEESTLTVSALRAAGIPARQVYTPRWAHTDDNHAWVEAWINGEWHYMGACEPEPVLDRGWFTEPVRRAMLVHTRSFGAPYGNENYINKYKCFTEVNVLSTYAVTKRIYVKVHDKEGMPVRDAKVEFQLYNYAEFYPIATVPSDENGICSFETGFGDLLVWARKGNDFNFSKISVSETDTLTLILEAGAFADRSINLDLSVPPVMTPYPGPSEDLIRKNAERVNTENQIRQSYIGSWINPADAAVFAMKINADSSRTAEIIKKGMGNYRNIMMFLEQTPLADRELALTLLGVLAEKDLRDTKVQVLNDHFGNLVNPLNLDKKGELFVNYVLNPRVSNEMLIAYREYLKNSLPADLSLKAINNPELIVDYVNRSIKIADNENYYKTPLTPRGTDELKVTDSKSRSVYFVSVCRSLGIPARLEPGSNTPQYYFNHDWNDVYFSDEKKPETAKGFLKVFSSETDPVPEYYIHFTLARFEDGRYNTLEYDDNKKVTEFKDELRLTPGHYMLVTGNRLNDSRILANISFFDLAPEQHLSLEIKPRKETQRPEISGSLDMPLIDHINLGPASRKSFKTEKGMVLAWIEPEKEPTKHLLNDLPLLKTELDSWGGCFLFLLTGSGKDEAVFNLPDYKGLPACSVSGFDTNMEILKGTGLTESGTGISYPFVILIDKKGNILYKSSGYRIGIGQEILKNIRFLQN